MILKFRMTQLRNSEFLGFHEAVLGIVTQNNPTVLNVVAPAAAYAAKIAGMEDLYKPNAFNPITAELEELDVERDEVFNGILKIVDGNARHFDPGMKASAVLLQRDLEKYGSGFVKEGYLSETVDLENIFHDWRTKPELQTAVDMLGILDWLMEMNRVNQLFKTKFNARTDSYAAETNETMKAKRVEVTAAYDVLCQFLNSYSFINDTAVYRTTITQINALIEQLSLQLKQRRGRAQAQKKQVGSQQ